ncbi:b-zip transcription factor (eurofung) [Anaeramoeba flamelloides]|uniref:B-zip transcription factor (Eurofung) n=1 Tax=Anaeramoeba flamelloides TaxID=1746091 RepID=A0AAV8A6B4_9EUKA|nr:b-zip transcription factor (eurofung) [Anaeramoeba flamelloides]
MNKFTFFENKQFIEFDNFDEDSFLPAPQTNLDLDQLFDNFQQETNFKEEISFFQTDPKLNNLASYGEEEVHFSFDEKEEQEEQEEQEEDENLVEEFNLGIKHTLVETETEQIKSPTRTNETKILVQPKSDSIGEKSNQNGNTKSEISTEKLQTKVTRNLKEIVDQKIGKESLSKKDPLLVLSNNFFKRHKRIPEELMTEKEKKLLRRMNKEEIKNLTPSQRIERKRARDRVCARSARQKRKEYIDYLQSQINGFNKENVNLSEKLSELNRENVKLKLIVSNLEKLNRNPNIKYKRKKLYQNILLQEVNL